MNIEQFINKYKPFNLSVSYNEYKINFNSITDYIYYDDIEDSLVDKDEIINTGNIYELYVYPDNAIGSYRIRASKLELAINRMSEEFEKLINDGRYKIKED